MLSLPGLDLNYSGLNSPLIPGKFRTLHLGLFERNHVPGFLQCNHDYDKYKAHYADWNFIPSVGQGFHGTHKLKTGNSIYEMDKRGKKGL